MVLGFKVYGLLGQSQVAMETGLIRIYWVRIRMYMYTHVHTCMCFDLWLSRHNCKKVALLFRVSGSKSRDLIFQLFYRFSSVLLVLAEQNV